ncbi:MAG: ribonucleoside-diphosphate reductase subunit alpha [Alphaproteobacteria bacterium]|nr:ribonucleoside-diphosphate reductase subunit alpha [Alphaproteobacteria bacterium]
MTFDPLPTHSPPESEPTLFDTAHSGTGGPSSRHVSRKGLSITVDDRRNNNITDFGHRVMEQSYLYGEENVQDMFARVAMHYADDNRHAQRLYDAMSHLWLMPATPILSNGGTSRGLPISCFVNEVGDSLHDIVGTWNENTWLASRGGGIGTYWGNVRSNHETIGEVGTSSGIFPFIKVMDSMTQAISQGAIRRGSAAVYLPVDHPEIEEFIEMRRVTGGEINRRMPELHHGVVITDAFMQAVERNLPWELRSPRKSREVLRTVKARDIWVSLLKARIETGEPYMLFIDHVNSARTESHKAEGLEVRTSNLCSEIMLPTGIDTLGEQRTAVCCLSSMNLDRFDEWGDNPVIIEDVMRFLDNVLTEFIDTAPAEFAHATYSAKQERSVGLGVMGFHSFLQTKGIPIESPLARSWNKSIFSRLRTAANKASLKLGRERGACPDNAKHGSEERFSYKMAVAPTATISIICGGTSPGIEPITANIYEHKTRTAGNVVIKNRALRTLLAKKGADTKEVWEGIQHHHGSVQHLTDLLDDHERDTFKTAFEINQYQLIDLAADRTPFICQGQSLNLFLPPNIHKRDLHRVHHKAWESGVKSLYYVRSRALRRAGDSLEAPPVDCAWCE